MAGSRMSQGRLNDLYGQMRANGQIGTQPIPEGSPYPPKDSETTSSASVDGKNIYPIFGGRGGRFEHGVHKGKTVSKSS